MAPNEYPNLSAADRRLLEAWLLTFDNAWDEDRLAKQVRDLPPRGEPLRRAALIELIKVDLRRRWQRGRGPRVEAYLKGFPELGTADNVLPELIRAEYEARLVNGDRPTPAQFLRRFPRQADEILRLTGSPAQALPPPPLKDLLAADNDSAGDRGLARGRRPRQSAGVAPARPRSPWPWIAVTTVFATLLVAFLAYPLFFRHGPPAADSPRAATNPSPQQPPQASLEPPQATPAVPPRDKDYHNPALAPVDEKRLAVRLDQESEMNAVGDAQTKLVLKMAPASDAFIRRMLTHKVRGEHSFEIPLRMQNLLDFMDLDAAGSLLEDVGGEFGKDAIRLRLREVGCARHQDGHWVYPLTSDPSAPYEMVKKEHSRVVTVRSLVRIGPGQALTQVVLALPEGAHDIRLVGSPSQLVYRLPTASPARAAGAGTPSFRVEEKPYIMSALYKLYGDRRFPKLWAARSAFRNGGEETLTDYRVRYRLRGYSDWSAWQQSDFVYPGQTVVDAFRPAIDGKVRDLRAPVPAAIDVEYEYTRPGGEKVRKTSTAPTRLLGFNDGVYTDVKLKPDMPWCEVLKGMPWVLASFTAGDDPVMREVAAQARQSAGGAAPTDGDEEAKRFLAAVFNLMRHNLAYEGAQGKVIDGVFSQYLKYGRDVLRTKKGTCVNTAILYASVAEAVGLESAIVVIPNHAFAAVRLPKSGQWFPVETTMGTVTVNAPFAAACAKARETFENAARSGLFLLVNVTEMRAKGVTPPTLADVGTNVLARWNIVAPVGVDDPTGSDAGSDREGPAAAIVSVRKEPDVVRDGLKGMAFHLHLKIDRARGVPCQVLVACLDKDNELVQTDLNGYHSPQGYLSNGVRVTPDDDEAEWKDLELFLPYEGIEVDPGTHHFKAVILVGSDEKPLTEKPTLVPFKIIKGAETWDEGPDCTLLDPGRFADGRPFYAMRLVQSESLKQATQRFPATDWDKEGAGTRTPACGGCCGASWTCAMRWPTPTAAASSTAALTLPT
jgi:hypothetical protein